MFKVDTNDRVRTVGYNNARVVGLGEREAELRDLVIASSDKIEAIPCRMRSAVDSEAVAKRTSFVSVE